jgi:hypothetical protein
LTDEGGRLESVHVRHLHVQQHDRELMREEPLQRLAPGVRLDEVLPQALQHRLERHQIGRLVIHQQNVDPVVGRIVGRLGGRMIPRQDGRPVRCPGGRAARGLHVRLPDRRLDA